MDREQRRECVSRIVNGTINFKYHGEQYFIKPPEPIEKSIGDSIYNMKKNEALQKGIMSFDEIMKFYTEKGLWSNEENEELESLPDKIEELKLQLYNAYAAFKSREPVKKALKKAKKKRMDLLAKRESFKKDSAEGVAEICRRGYEHCSNIENKQGKKLFNPEDYHKQEMSLINTLLTIILRLRLSEEEVRELSRNEPWRGLWSVGKSESGVFGKPSIFLSDEQRLIISWSKVYDSIHESPECPPDEVLEDDDMLDGWLILQSRKREKDKKQKHSDSVGNGVNGDEVYVFADDSQEAARIYGMNTSDAKSVVRTRQKQIDATTLGKGLPAQKTLDAQMEMQKQSNEKFKEHVKK